MLKNHHPYFKFIAITLLFLISPAHSYVTVGTDAECDLPPASLQNALTNHDSVRVTNQVTYAPIQITNHHAELLGGFDNCSDADQLIHGANYTQISGNNTQTVINLSTTSAGGHLPRSVVLSGLDIHSGANSNFSIGGGINIIGNMNVSINNSIIRNNVASTFGGGIYIFGQNGASLLMNDVVVNNNDSQSGGGLMAQNNAQVTLINSEFSANSADNGGGLTIESSSSLSLENSQLISNTATSQGAGVHCLNNGQINVDEDSWIAYNESDITGGGIHAANNCTVKVSSGDNLAPGLSNAGLNFNTAGVLGGGAYIFNATLLLVGNENHFVNVLNNSTLNANTGQGGGIYARGASANVRIINGRLNLNQANLGSAIYLTGGARLNMRRTSGQCFGNQLCSEVADNNANFSGTIMTNQCATADVYQTTFRGNHGGLASVLHLEGNESEDCESTFEGNQVYNNQDDGSDSSTLFWLDKKTALDFAFNTVTDNLSDRIFSISSTNNSSQKLNINSSLIWNSPAVIFYEPVGNHTYSGQCFDVHSFDALPEDFGPFVISQDPLFENPLFNNYQMTQESPTMDYCDTSTYQPKHHDIIGVPRGFAWLPPFLGHYDMGAFEYNHINENDVIFYDRFD